MGNNPDYNKSNHTQQMYDGILNDAKDLMLQVTGDKELLSEETDFPLEVFPAPMRDVVIEMWRGLSYPVDFTAGAMLAAVAMCTGSTVRAKFKTGWVSFCNMFVAVVGCPGANKTNPLKAILAPLFEYDSLLDEKNREKVRAYRETLAIPAKHREEMGLPLCPEEPIIEQLVVQDVTQEAIKKVLSHNPRGVGLYQDELDGWISNFTRYNKDSSDEQFWLSVFSNSWSKNGRKSEMLANTVYEPVVTVLGSIQDDLLQSLCIGKRGKNGFFDRILFTRPRVSKVGKNNKDEPNDEILKQWDNLMWKLLNRPVVVDERGRIVPTMLSYTEEAKDIIIEWQNAEADDCNARGKLKPAKGSILKLMTYVHRFCIVLHVMRNLCNECELGVIDGRVATDAISLVRYFARSAIRSIEYIYVSQLSATEQILYENLPASFTPRLAKDIVRQEELIMCDREVERFLADKLNVLFDRPQHGQYIKIYQY